MQRLSDWKTAILDYTGRTWSYCRFASRHHNKAQVEMSQMDFSGFPVHKKVMLTLFVVY